MSESLFTMIRLEKAGHISFFAIPRVGTDEKAMLFIHGMAGFKDYLIPQMEYFASRGIMCFAPDIMGHGERNNIDVSGKGILDYVDDVSHYADTVMRSETTAHIVLVGHSMGGLIAAKLAEKRSDVSAAVLITPAPPRGVALYPGGLVSFTLGDVSGLAKKMVGHGTFIPSRKFLESLFVDPKASKSVIDQWEQKRVSEESTLVARQLGLSLLAVDERKIAAPMLVIGAKKDKIVHHRVARSAARYYGADYHLIGSLGHMCLFESGHEEVSQVMSAWLVQKSIYTITTPQE